MKAFEGKKTTDGYITLVGANGDSLTTKDATAAKNFAAYLIANYHADRLQKTDKAIRAGAGLPARSVRPAGPAGDSASPTPAPAPGPAGDAGTPAGGPGDHGQPGGG